DAEVAVKGVLPLVRVLVADAPVDRHADVGDRGAGRRVAQLGVVDEVADDGDHVLDRHWSSCREAGCVAGAATGGGARTVRTRAWSAPRAGRPCGAPPRRPAAAGARARPAPRC